MKFCNFCKHKNSSGDYCCVCSIDDWVCFEPWDINAPNLDDVINELQTQSIPGEYAYSKVSVVDIDSIKEILAKYFAPHDIKE